MQGPKGFTKKQFLTFFYVDGMLVIDQILPFGRGCLSKGTAGVGARFSTRTPLRGWGLAQGHPSRIAAEAKSWSAAAEGAAEALL